MIRGKNEHAIEALAKHFRGTPHVVRFIEFMDVGTLNAWDANQVVSAGEIRERLSTGSELEPIARNHFAQTCTYKGMMYSGVPNLICTFGYINASWTLRADLTSEYVCRLINHMDETRTCQVTPRLRDADRDMPARAWIHGFTSGYMRRMMHRFPKQGDHEPWINPQNYSRDKKMIRSGRLEDGALVFSHRAPAAPSAAPPARALQAAE